MLAGWVVGGKDHVENSVAASVGDLEFEGCLIAEIPLEAPAHDVGQFAAELDRGQGAPAAGLKGLEPEIGDEHRSHLLSHGVVDGFSLK
jgi:hypothetical protein